MSQLSPKDMSHAQFRGFMAAKMQSLTAAVENVQKEVETLRKDVNDYRVCTASLKTKVKVLWAAAGVIGTGVVTIIVKAVAGL